MDDHRAVCPPCELKDLLEVCLPSSGLVDFYLEIHQDIKKLKWSSMKMTLHVFELVLLTSIILFVSPC